MIASGSTATATQSSAVTKEEVSRLQRSFQLVDSLARQLEQAYRRLEVDAPAESPAESSDSEVRRLQAEFDGLLDAIPCGVVTAEADGTIRRVNQGAEGVLGRPEAELIGRNARTLLDHRGKPILLLGRDEVKIGATVERLVCALDGSARHLSGCLAEMPGGGRLEILADQTEVAHLRNQVHRLDTLAAMGEMAAGIAHEIRNPMSGVEGFAGLLEKSLEGDEPPESQVIKRYTNRIRRGVAEVNHIITSLLMWARPEKAVREPVDLALLVREVADDLGEEEGSDLFAWAPPLQCVQVRADRLKLKLALTNVIKNAREAAGEEGTVAVNLVAAERNIEIQVEDSGAGVAPELIERLFRPFTTNKPGGTGLGLALTRKFLELHGGTIHADKSPLGGALFRLSIPVESPRGDAS